MKQIGILAAFLCAWAGTDAQTSGRIDNDFMHALSAGMTRMDRAMAAAPMNGNVDHDFATMMLPHHAGAIDMAKAELTFGKDPVMRRLAQEIIVDQDSEITAMNVWLKKNISSPATEK